MSKLKTIVLMIGLFFVVDCYCVNGISGTKDGVPITIIKSAGNYGGLDRSGSISASIDGHDLTVIFYENLGEVVIKITDASNCVIDCLVTRTPTGYLYYIFATGHYTIDFILPDGDIYSGEFDVTD